MNLVYIYGPPGVGKLAVATELAKLTGYKLFHNHFSIDCVLPVFSFGMEPFDRLVQQIRRMVLTEAARQDVDVIFTFVYARDVDDPIVTAIDEQVTQAGGRVCFVQLVCDQETLEQRVVGEDRTRMRKIDTVERIQRFVTQYELFTPIPGRESLSIDNTNVAPDEAARQIGEHYGLLAT
ncbi:MAG: AAA family ATPase [Dehalococcoidia bacterium]|nr:AAA family ATPase [Dehalococcoidia bacterium]